MARLLLIEDSATSLELMVYLLQMFGHETLCASDGEAGLALAETEAVDLILCDINLPKLDGYELARRLKTHPLRAATPLVAVTALAMQGDRDRALAAGFDGYIPKPLDPEEFLLQVESYLQPLKGARHGNDPGR